MKSFQRHASFSNYPRPASLLSLSLGIILSSASSYAELWEGGWTHGHRQMSLGGYVQVYGQTYERPSSVMAFGHYTYGVNDQIDIGTRLGLGMSNPYVGFSLKTNFIDANGFALAGFVEVLHQNSPKLGFYPIVSYRFGESSQTGSTELYLAPVLGLTYRSGLLGIYGMVLGASYRITQYLRMYVEGNVNGINYYYAGSGGIKTHF